MPTKPNEIYISDENPKIIKQGIGELLFEAIKKKTNYVAQVRFFIFIYIKEVFVIHIFLD